MENLWGPILFPQNFVRSITFSGEEARERLWLAVPGAVEKQIYLANLQNTTLKLRGQGLPIVTNP
jgi:hypothetical protein